MASVIHYWRFQGGSSVGVRVSVTFQLMCIHIIFSRFRLLEWPSFEKELLTRLTIFLFVILVISRFDFKRWIWVLIALAPGLCIFVT